MRNYFAGFEMTAETMDSTIARQMRYRLISYFYLMQLSKEKRNLFFTPEFKKHRWSFMLDSGAYSAHTQGKSIDFDDYLYFCWKNYEDFNYFANLDSIPENWTKPALAEEAAEKSLNYYLDMRDTFRKNNMDENMIIPVYHQGEDEKHLKWMLDERIPYIGLSPSNDRERTSPGDKWHFLMCCYDTIKKSSNHDVKTHLFGLSDYSILPEFPCYSADSTTWGNNAAQYQIIVPRRRSTFMQERIKEAEENGEPHPRWNYDFHTKWDFSDTETVLIGSVGKKLNDSKYFLNKFPKKRVKEIIEFMADFGLHIGYQEIRERVTLGPDREILNDDETPLDPRTQKGYLKKRYGDDFPTLTVTGEHKIMSDGEPRYGIGMAMEGSMQMRLLMNAITVNEWTATLDPLAYADPPYPEPDLTPEEIATREHVHQKVKERKSKKMKTLAKFRRTK